MIVITPIYNLIPFIRFTHCIESSNKTQTIMYNMHTLTEEEGVMQKCTFAVEFLIMQHAKALALKQDLWVFFKEEEMIVINRI